MRCKICNKKNDSVFCAGILGKYDISYFHCSNCGFLQTEDPYWLKEAYEDSISVSDTGYLQRNIIFSQKVTIFLSLYFDKKAKFLDYAGGYGVFVRLMRDLGSDFYWSDKYTKNIFARGFEYTKDEKYDVVTSFESFEHFVNPIDEIERILSISNNIIFSTELLPTPILKPNAWWYYGLDHGQHISFYSKETLKFIAKKYKLHYSNLGGLHFLTRKRISGLKLQILKFSRFGLHNLLK